MPKLMPGAYKSIVISTDRKLMPIVENMRKPKTKRKERTMKKENHVGYGSLQTNILQCLLSVLVKQNFTSTAVGFRRLCYIKFKKKNKSIGWDRLSV